MKNKITYTLLFLSLFLLISCHHHTKKNIDTWKVAVLQGPSVILFTSWLESPPIIKGKQIELVLIETLEEMEAVLFREEADIAVLPLINAARLYNQGVNYQLGGCPVWGNLYLIEKENSPENDETLYLFGAESTPDVLTRFYCDEHNLKYDYNYSYPTPESLLQAISTGKVNRTALTEPFLSMALEKNPSFRIVADLNKPGNRIGGFPQTALLYKNSTELQATVDEVLKGMSLYLNQFPEESIQILEEKKVFPKGIITPETIRRCKIEYYTAQQAEETIYGFLDMICRYEPQTIGKKLPERSFIYKTSEK